MEIQLERTRRDLTEKHQAAVTDLEDKSLVLQTSLALSKKLEGDLASLKATNGELKASKTRLQDHLKNIQGELAAVKDELNNQITEKERGLKKAEVRSCYWSSL